MDENKLPWTSVLLVTLGLTGAYFQSRPLESSRPQSTVSVSFKEANARRVISRPYEDPLNCISKAEEFSDLFEMGERGIASRKKHNEDSALRAINGISTNGNAINYSFMAVMLTESFSQDQIEHRIRTRKAVYSAFLSAHYSPLDVDKLSFFIQSDFLFKGDNRYTAFNREFIPFELFYDAKTHEAWVVLWIKEDWALLPFEKGPSAPAFAVNSLFNNISSYFGSKAERALILGPRTTGGLDALSRELEKASAEYVNSFDNSIVFVAATPTGSEPHLIQRIEDSNRNWKIYRPGQPIIQRTITNDSSICEALSDELKLRIFSRNSHIILISENDTLYGRSLPPTFIRAARDKDLTPSSNIHAFSYFRQLEGTTKKTAGASDARPINETGLSVASKLGGTRMLFSAVSGESQLSELERFPSFIKSHPALREKHISAIGVLGSDIFDKLTIIAALKPEYPNAIFFTNNLDAQMFHSSQISYTRNMIVASPFDLDLNTEEVPGNLKEGYLPFRDSYSTSVFLSTLYSLNCLNKTQMDSCMYPKVFEIGNQGPVQISTKAKTQDSYFTQFAAFVVSGMIIIAYLIFYMSIAGKFNDLSIQQRAKLLATRTLACTLFLGSVFGAHVIISTQLHESRNLCLAGLLFLIPVLLLFLWKNNLRPESREKADDQIADNHFFHLILAFVAIIVYPIMGVLLGVDIKCSILPYCLVSGMFCLIVIPFFQYIEHEMLFDSLTSTLFICILTPGACFLAWYLVKDPSIQSVVGMILLILVIYNACKYDRVFSARNSELHNRDEQGPTFGFEWSAMPLISLVVSCLVASCLTPWKDAEPLRILDGISAWPCIAIRCVAVISAVMSILWVRKSSKERDAALLAQFFNTADFKPSGDTSHLNLSVTNFWQVISRMFEWKLDDGKQQGSVDASRILECYLESRKYQDYRTFVFSLLLIFIGLCLLIFVFGFPYMPIRGRDSVVLAIIVLGLAIFFSQFLLMQSLDEVILLTRFFRSIKGNVTRWASVGTKFGAGGTSETIDGDILVAGDPLVNEYRREALCHYRDIRFIETMTEKTSYGIFLFCMVLLLLIIARSPIFDNWPWNTGLFIIMGMNLLFAAAAGWIIRRYAESVRTYSLQRLSMFLDQLQEVNADKDRIGMISDIREKIFNANKGALAPLLDAPIIRAILFPTGGFGLFSIFEWLVSNGIFNN